MTYAEILRALNAVCDDLEKKGASKRDIIEVLLDLAREIQNESEEEN